MSDETKRAAQEYLAGRLTEQQQVQEQKFNAALAVERAPLVWREVKEIVSRKCDEWNAITNERTLVCKETVLGDVRIWCISTSRHLTVHFDSRNLLITVKNAGRLDHETDVVMRIEGFRSGAGADDRDVRMIRNEEVVNIDMLILGELRVLVGMTRQKNA
ncbi:MAG TPA: hypothetical protein VN982_05840 [Candidatus Dormibacteraeota bacterium]|nr:hypothetical protein [Candidatus Dormibacteraeota bacterium]